MNAKSLQDVCARHPSEHRPHDFRRTATSIMAGMGVPRLVVSKILNHMEPGITKVYDRYSCDREKQEAIRAWGARLARFVSVLELVGASEEAKR